MLPSKILQGRYVQQDTFFMGEISFSSQFFFKFPRITGLGKCGKKVEKIQKLEYLENKMSLLDKAKDIFHSL